MRVTPEMIERLSPETVQELLALVQVIKKEKTQAKWVAIKNDPERLEIQRQRSRKCMRKSKGFNARVSCV